MRRLDNGLSRQEYRRYVREVWKLLPGGFGSKRAAVQELKSDIQDYLCEYPVADRVALNKRFGTPEQIAANAVMAMTTTERKKQLPNRRMIITRISLILFLVIAIVFLTVFLVRQYNLNNLKNVRYINVNDAGGETTSASESQ